MNLNPTEKIIALLIFHPVGLFHCKCDQKLLFWSFSQYSEDIFTFYKCSCKNWWEILKLHHCWQCWCKMFTLKCSLRFDDNMCLITPVTSKEVSIWKDWYKSLPKYIELFDLFFYDFHAFIYSCGVTLAEIQGGIKIF